ncbi:hypothetical protein JHK85_013503 [Glycine max]|nr:hypothetical protein JHK85_013503 [Glycine max]
MGATYWEFDSDSCHSKMLRLTPEPPKGSQSSIDCDCTSEINTCHVVGITFKRLNLPGMLPPYLAKLPNLTQVDFALNYLSGTIPKEWGSTKLTNISLFVNRIFGEIPKELGSITTLTYLILSSNKLSGKLPVTFAKLQNLTDLKISDINSPSQDFPMLRNMTGMTILVLRNCHITGELPSYFWSMKNLNMLDVSFNKLVGEIPVIDVPVGHLRFLFLTGNMLSGNLPESLLKDGSSLNLNLNLFRSFSGTKLRGLLPCSKISNCPAYSHCFHVNCGGKNVKVMENDENIQYVGDDGALGSSAAKYFIDYENHWGFSSTGDFLDDGDYLNSRYIRSLPSSNLPELYKTARVAPISLTYFRYCMENGKYTVKLHFAEIQFSNDNTYSSLGRRLFDIYVQGTTRIPVSGVYGPLISAFSIVSDTERRDCLTGTFTLKQIRDATEDFSPDNKIGEGGFGPVYKGQLSDGTLVAVKQLSSRSRQGNGEFLNEIGMISCLQHPNLVKLHGFCIEGDQLILVYEYMENNSLAHALFSSKDQLKLDWATRLRICIGIAKGLAFLHEESRLKIVHRDIKATNVLLDGNLNPKISDFGLARLDEEKTHVTTRIAGTIKITKFPLQAFHLQRAENLIEMVDERLRSEVNPTEAITLMKVALLCTSVSPSHRPTMSEVVNMLEGRISIPNAIQQPTDFSEDLRFKAMRDIHQQRENHSLSTS